MRKYRKNNKGFTLIELVIVVAVLAILVGLLAPSYTKYVKKSKVTKCEAQRAEIERVYQIACIEDGEIARFTNAIEREATINGMPPIDYLASLGYFDKDEAKCPVYNENYKMDVRNNVALVICPCVDNVLNYIDSAVKIFNESLDRWRKEYDNNSNKYERAWLIQDFYNKFGGLPEVSSSMKKGTKYENIDKPLYWRPYNYSFDSKSKVCDNSQMILYASGKNSGDHDGWKAGLLYIDGKIYETPGDVKFDSKGELDFGFNVSDLYHIGTAGYPQTIDEWIKQKELILVN